MSEIHAYRANDELAAAWRAHVAERARHIETVVKPFEAEYPNHEPMVNRWEDVIGFRDGDPNNPPPKGLSRSVSRGYLIPGRGKDGDEWRERMKTLSVPTNRREVLRKFGFRDQLYTRGDGRTYLGFPSALDFGDDGVFIYAWHEINPLPDCVTAVKRSQFYAAQERAQERQRGGEAA